MIMQEEKAVVEIVVVEQAWGCVILKHHQSHFMNLCPNLVSSHLLLIIHIWKTDQNIFKWEHRWVYLQIIPEWSKSNSDMLAPTVSQMPPFTDFAFWGGAAAGTTPWRSLPLVVIVGCVGSLTLAFETPVELALIPEQTASI